MSLSLITSLPTPAELESYRIISEVAASNPQWKKLGGGGDTRSVVATILSVMLLARELGISPMQSISGGINNVQGKFEISARLMNQLIRKHGHQLAIKVCNDQICSIWTKRKDTGEEHVESYCMEEAVRSGLVKPGSAWQKVPTDMLFARCISRLARRIYPDCLGGCYVEGELQESILGNPVKPQDLEDVTALKNEMPKLEIVEEEIVLPLPDDINPELVEEYITEICKATKKTPNEIKKAALTRMEGFIVSYLTWWHKKNPSESADEVLSV